MSVTKEYEEKKNLWLHFALLSILKRTKWFGKSYALSEKKGNQQTCSRHQIQFSYLPHQLQIRNVNLSTRTSCMNFSCGSSLSASALDEMKLRSTDGVSYDSESSLLWSLNKYRDDRQMHHASVFTNKTVFLTHKNSLSMREFMAYAIVFCLNKPQIIIPSLQTQK